MKRLQPKALLLICWIIGLIVAGSAAAAPDVRRIEYRLGAGDSIRISVFQNPDLTVETRVSESGAVTYPLVGAVQLGGLTIAEAERSIAGKLRAGGYVRQPQVNILVLQIRGNQVSVLGQVGKPGRYPIETTDTRVSDMLAVAGGSLPTGSDTVVLTGIRKGRPFRREIDIASLFLDKKGDMDEEVAAGDVLYVDRAPVFYIYGEVQHAGSYRLDRNMTVMQALAAGGGLTPRGTERGLRLHRRSPDGQVEVIDAKASQRLQPDDVIYVRESLF